MGKLRDFFSFQDTVSNEVLESQRKKHAELIYQLKGQLEVRDLYIGIHFWYKNFLIFVCCLIFNVYEINLCVQSMWCWGYHLQQGDY